MDLFSDMIAAVQSDLTTNGDSTMYPLATIKLALNRSYRKAGSFYRWPQNEDAVKTSTVANQEYYDYPENWTPDSLWKITVDGVDYGSPLAFEDYLNEKENNIPSGKKQLWATQWTRFFLYPTPTTNGNNNIVIWGKKAIVTLTADADTTIFSYAMPECNEAVVLEAVAILKNKGDIIQPVMRSFVGGTMLLSIEAQNILRNSWEKIKQEQMKYRKEEPIFNVPDFFSTGKSKSSIGDFE